MERDDTQLSQKPEELPIFDKITWTRGQQGRLGFEVVISGSFDKGLMEKSIEILDWLDARRGERMILKQVKDDKKEELLNE